MKHFYTVQCTIQYTMWCTFLHYIVYYIVHYVVHYVVYISTLYSVLYSTLSGVYLYTIQCTVHKYILYSFFFQSQEINIANSSKLIHVKSVYSVHCTVYIIWCIYILCNIQFTLYTLHYIKKSYLRIYKVACLNVVPQCTLYIVQYVLYYNVHCALYSSLQCTVHCTLYSVQCTVVYSEHCVQRCTHTITIARVIQYYYTHTNSYTHTHTHTLIHTKGTSKYTTNIVIWPRNHGVGAGVMQGLG